MKKCMQSNMAAGAAMMWMKAMMHMINKSSCMMNKMAENMNSSSCWQESPCGDSSVQADDVSGGSSSYTVNRPANLVEAVLSDHRFSTLASAVKAAGLVETLQAAGPFTVFAPTNEAFAKLPQDTVAELLKPENKQRLAGILTFHVVEGQLKAESIESCLVTTVNGATAEVKVTAAGTRIAGANVIETDLTVSNGVIHVIDSVILPPEPGN
jgi:uncharacterized surface protein with fasciclin (FAS1) repeats